MVKATMSPLPLVLCAIFFFSANVLAVSAVLGVDLGTEYIKAALVKPGIPLEIVLTKDSRRKETSSVAFKPLRNGATAGEFPERAYGSDAMALSARFPGDVYPNLKTILGLPTDSSIVQEYAARHPALQLESHKTRNTAMFKSPGAFTPEEEAWMVEELLAMELQSVQRNAEALAGAGTAVRSVVLTVPPFYSIEEKRAVELAAELAGLKVLSLISDGLAVGLNYATSRTFPAVDEKGKPEYHMVFDMGAGSTKTTIMKFQSRSVKDVGKFNKTVQEVEVLGTGWDRSLGGDALNSLIVDDMVAQFVESSGAKKVSATAESVLAHGRAVATLSKEAERLRHILSANTNTQASFEGLYDDVDFKYKVSRAEFEEMSQAHAARVAATVQSALDMAGLQVGDLDSVILHGGASRTPFVQKELENIFGTADKLRSNVNADEAAVFGAGFRAAQISPSFRVKEIKISEGSVYSAGMRWTNANTEKQQHQRLWTPTSHLGAAAKEVTFNNLDDFSIDFYQQVTVDGPSSEYADRPTKVMTTKNLTATVAMLKEKFSCEASEVQFKVGVRLSGENGEVEVSKAAVQCEADVPEKEGIIDGMKNLFGFGKKDQQPLQDGEETSESTEEASAAPEAETSSASSPAAEPVTSSEPTSSSTSEAEAEATAEAKPTSSKKQLVTIPVDYELTKTGIPQLSKADLATLKDRLKAFEASDRARRQREEALNQLEGYTYKIRDLLDREDFIAASTEQERASLDEGSRDASDFLYGDGADAPEKELKARLKGLQDIVKPIQTRIEEAEKRPGLVEGLKEALDKAVDMVKSLKEKIDEAEASKVADAESAGATPEASASTTGDFDGLEDDEPAAKAAEADDAPKPLPPLYTYEDLKETEELSKEVSAWLADMETAQAQLAPTDDPVLTAKELVERRNKVDKAVLDLAMKGMKNFEKKHKKPAGKSGSKSKKGGKSSKTESAPRSGETVRLDSQEDIDNFLRQFEEQQKAAEEGANGSGSGDAKPTHDEL